MLRMGILGMSQGNGHPYSWAAICNGYAPGPMAQCGFPVISDYLGRQSWPDDQLPNARVTHVWAQDSDRAQHIAQATKITHVVNTPEDMIGEIDALLLARDDAENHIALAEPFLQAGLPVYVDKPIALSRSALDKLIALTVRPGQIFSCSALRYAEELRLNEIELQTLGPLRLISASTPKYWDTYAAHLIDPLLANILPNGRAVRRLSTALPADGRQLVLDWFADAEKSSASTRVVLTTLGRASGPLSFRFHGENGWCEKVFVDSFSAFRAALSAFADFVLAPDATALDDMNLRIVEIIEMGRSETAGDDCS